MARGAAVRLAISLGLVVESVSYRPRFPFSAEKSRHRQTPIRGTVRSLGSNVRGDSNDAFCLEERAGTGRQDETEPRENLSEYFARLNLTSAEVVPKRSAGARAEGGVIVKSIIFQANGEPFVAVLKKHQVAETMWLAEHFGLPNDQVTLAGANYVEELTGFVIGTIPPLGHRKPLRTLVDAEVMQYAVLFGGGGQSEFVSRISREDLLKATNAEVVQFAKRKEEKENEGDERIPSASTESAMVEKFASPTGVSQPGTAWKGLNGHLHSGADPSSSSRRNRDTAPVGNRVLLAAMRTMRAALQVVNSQGIHLDAEYQQIKDFVKVLEDRAHVDDNLGKTTGRNGGSYQGPELRPLATAVPAPPASTEQDNKSIFGQALAQTSGTPVVDAVGGDVHLVAVVAGKRSLTKLLHFLDLVPPSEDRGTPDQTCYVRRAWMTPGTPSGRPPRPIQVQLIMGKTLVDRLGKDEASKVMRSIKRGQLVYITGRPTPQSRQHFLNEEGSVDEDQCRADSPQDLFEEGGNGDTYDLVCCSMRLLEDVPSVPPELVGKGDTWTNSAEYLKMDLPEESIVYVDSPAALREMGDYLGKVMAEAVLQEEPPLVAYPAAALDCEWQPTRMVGESRHPVSLLQLAAGERTYVIDMLHVCRSREAATAALASRSAIPAGILRNRTRSKLITAGLTECEELLERALAPILADPTMIKVGMGPKTDLLCLMRSYPHIPCFRRIAGVIDLDAIARNAKSLRGTASEEKGSLSRLSRLVLGKPIDKSEQCADWGRRPLSGRQKRYAALDARATLLLYRALAPEVPLEHFKTLSCNYTYDPRAFGIAVRLLNQIKTPIKLRLH